MTRYWVLGLLIAAVAVIYLVRRLLDSPRSPESSVDIPLEEPVRSRPEVPPVAEDDDTAPAVLSPPEWSPPKKAA